MMNDIFYSAVILIVLTSLSDAQSSSSVVKEDSVDCRSGYMTFSLQDSASDSPLVGLWNATKMDESPGTNFTLVGPCGELYDDGVLNGSVIIAVNFSCSEVKQISVVPYWYKRVAFFTAYAEYNNSVAEGTNETINVTVSRNEQFDVTCRYNMEILGSSYAANFTDSNARSPGGQGDGKPELLFEFRDAFGAPLNEAVTNEAVVLNILLKNDAYSSIQPIGCYFSDSGTFNDRNGQTENFIMNSCPIANLNPLVTEQARIDLKSYSVKFKAFYFLSSPSVWVHCRIRVCLVDAHCMEDCWNVTQNASGTRVKRSASDGQSFGYSSSRLNVRDGNFPKNLVCSNGGSFALLYVIIAILCGALVAALVALAVMYYLRRNFSKIHISDESCYPEVPNVQPIPRVMTRI